MVKKMWTLVAVLGTMALVPLFSLAQKGQPPKPPDPLAEWEYPKAKQEWAETWQQILPWVIYKTPDPFEKVWDFYFKEKALRGIPGTPKVPRGVVVFSNGQEEHHVLYICDPENRVGLLVIYQRDKTGSKKDKTINITITQPVKGKATTIVVAVNRGA